MRTLRIVGLLAGGALVPLAVAAVAGGWYLNQAGVGPRALARHVAPDGNERNALLLYGRRWAATILAGLERDGMAPIDPAGLTIGAHAAADIAASPGARAVTVFGVADMREAIGRAAPGDVITLAPGVYRFAGTGVEVRQAGAENGIITLRAPAQGTVVIEFQAREGFSVSAPYWRFENLSIRGVCRNDSDCDHAFHVVGGAHHFTAFNNDIADFNAHFKINGSGGRFPDHGTLEANTLTNSAPRRTANSVTPIDLVGASGWTIRRNLIADFIKQGGDQISYGAFAKGAGSRNVFQQNIVWCERLLHDQPGQRVGISLGGGGTLKPFCREGKCITEQEDSVIASNLVASCSDDGVYLNNAARSTVVHNSLVGTAGVALRYAGTSADVEGNLVDGPIRSHNGALVREVDNRATPVAYRYVGYQPDGGWFANRNGNSLAWAAEAPRRGAAGAGAADLCGAPRPAAPTYGAFEDFSACRRGAASK